MLAMETGSAAKPRRVGVLLNARGGTLRTTDIAAEQARLAELFAVRGLEAEVEAVDGDAITERAREALERAKRGELAAIVVGGGDGTLSAVAGVLAGTGVPLGILPLGTLNHFAKDLGVPIELEAAVNVVAGGKRRRVDVAEVNGRVFVNNSSVGIYPHMVLERERRQSEGWSKWPAMAIAFLRMMRRFPRRKLLICSEGDVEPCRTPCLFVGNNAYGTGLTTLGTRARLDGGELCLYVARHGGPLGFARLAFLAALGRLDEEREFDTRRLSAAEIRSRTSRLLVARDGEVEAMRPPLRYRIRPGALDVFAPAART
jgi:diacylglycerol kinase family enzyme